MYHTEHGYPVAEQARPAMGHPGPGGSTFPGPTPSPFPPSPMMPGPSVHPGGCSSSHGSTHGPERSPQPGSHIGNTSQADCCGGASHHPNTASTGNAHPGASQSAPIHHPPLHEAYQYGYYPHGAYPAYDAPNETGYSILGLHLSDGNFWKGAIIGTALTLLITNETVQRAIMLGIAKAYSAAQEGVGEIKEMFQDAQAELKKPAD